MISVNRINLTQKKGFLNQEILNLMSVAEKQMQQCAIKQEAFSTIDLKTNRKRMVRKMRENMHGVRMSRTSRTHPHIPQLPKLEFRTKCMC